jgi:geranylgeranyl diphosphate synthase type I
MTSPLDADDLRARVGRRLEAFLRSQRPGLEQISDSVEPLLDAVTELLAGGKRLRPAFAYWGFRGAGGIDDGGDDGIVTAATALELLQACALVHDDVMDGSDTRRGAPSVHRRFASLHQRSEWLGPADAFGVGAAILLGDLCLSWADELLLTASLPADRLTSGKQVYDLMRTELMAGQYLDLVEQARGGGSPERAMTVVRFKSAKYTIERPLHLGAALAGATPDDAVMKALTGYGLPLGEAFQLRDDLLGVFGDPAETGKPAGDDLREGKQTVLIAAARQAATPAQATVLRSGLGNPELNDAGVAALREVIIDTGARDHLETTITELTEQALAALDGPVAEPAAEVLASLAVAATSRRA